MAFEIHDSREIAFEEDLFRNPSSLPHWLAYLDFITPSLSSSNDSINDGAIEEEIDNNDPSKKNFIRDAIRMSSLPSAIINRRFFLYERGVAALPHCYELWYSYLLERVYYAKRFPLNDSIYHHTNAVFDRSLLTMNKMPTIFHLYANFLMDQKLITKTRRLLDDALISLPANLHLQWIWPLYLQLIDKLNVPPDTAIRIYRRYLQIDPSAKESYINYCKKKKRWDEAALNLAECLNDEKFISKEGKSKHDLWMELLKIIVKHPTQLSSSAYRLNSSSAPSTPSSLTKAGLDVESIIRSGIRRFASEVGRLWSALASYFIHLGQFERARDIYEEGLEAVMTVRDFSIIFDAYTKFEDGMTQTKMAELDEKKQKLQEYQTQRNNKSKLIASKGKGKGEEEESESDDEDDDDEKEEDVITSLQADIADDEIDLDMKIARLEYLAERRPFLLSSVLLRQNPHNVDEWKKRVELYQNINDDDGIIRTYSEALHTIQPDLAVGKFHLLWIDFAKYYETKNDFNNTRLVFDKAVAIPFKSVDALVHVWCALIEFELRHSNYHRAIQLCKRAIHPPKGSHAARRSAAVGENDDDEGETEGGSLLRVHRSTKLWALYADLEENFGSLSSTKAVYDHMISFKIVTPQIILNYAALLEANNYFEDSFRVYERGISLFQFPHVFPLWLVYLKKFITRYQGKKLERTRELFEQSVEHATPEFSKRLFLLYAKYEEDFGLARRAMDIYERGAKKSEGIDKLKMWTIYASRCAARFGVSKTREVYDRALKDVGDDFIKDIILRYAQLERHLGEISRARALYRFGSQYADPRKEVGYWTIWNDFELSHGNEETFTEMKRMRRTVLSQYAQTQIIPNNPPTATAGLAASAMATNFVASSSGSLSGTVSSNEGNKRKLNQMERLEQSLASKPSSNPDELDIDGEAPSSSSTTFVGAMDRIKQSRKA